MRSSILALLTALMLAACSQGGSEGAGEPAADAPAAAPGAVTFVGTQNLQWEQTSKSATLADGPLEITGHRTAGMEGTISIS